MAADTARPLDGVRVLVVDDNQENRLVAARALERSGAEVRTVTEARIIRGSLRELTGLDPGRSNRSWLTWWEREGESWLESQGSTR